MHCDNQIAKVIWTKNVEIDYYHIHESVMNQEIGTPFTPSSEQIADIFTNILL